MAVAAAAVGRRRRALVHVGRNGTMVWRHGVHPSRHDVALCVTDQLLAHRRGATLPPIPSEIGAGLKPALSRHGAGPPSKGVGRQAGPGRHDPVSESPGLRPARRPGLGRHDPVTLVRGRPACIAPVTGVIHLSHSRARGRPNFLRLDGKALSSARRTREKRGGGGDGKALSSGPPVWPGAVPRL